MSIHMTHPGPRATKRVIAVPCHPRSITGLAHKGQSLMGVIRQVFTRNQCKGGMVDLAGLTLEGLSYVLPTTSQDKKRVAWYSPSVTVTEPRRLISGTASFGWRYGAPFLHAHAKWQTPEGDIQMGQLLPRASLLSEDHVLSALGTMDAWFESVLDPETGCKLFTPQGAESGRGVMFRLFPGEELVPAIERIAQKFGLENARIHGLGNLDQVSFASGQKIEPSLSDIHITQSYLRHGRADIHAHAITMNGKTYSAPLARSGNTVCVTFEVLLMPSQDASLL